MANERVTIKVESNIGEDGPLTVADTLRQLLDSFALLSAAIAEEKGGETVEWKLVGLTKNSPATATAEAYTEDRSVEIAPLVHRGKRRFAADMSALSDGKVAPWMINSPRVAKAVFKRNINGVGRTTFVLEKGERVTTLVEKTARLGLLGIEALEKPEMMDVLDLSRSERGTIEANVAEARSFRGKPALYVRERLSGAIVPCVLSEQAAKEAGPTHSWLDAWQEKRVRIKGQIFYNKLGKISRVLAEKVTDVSPKHVSMRELQKIDILEGKTPVEHLNAHWGYDGE